MSRKNRIIHDQDRHTSLYMCLVDLKDFQKSIRADFSKPMKKSSILVYGSAEYCLACKCYELSREIYEALEDVILGTLRKEATNG